MPLNSETSRRWPSCFWVSLLSMVKLVSMGKDTKITSDQFSKLIEDLAGGSLTTQEFIKLKKRTAEAKRRIGWRERTSLLIGIVK